MVVSVSARHEITNGHRDDEDEQGIERIDVNERRDEHEMQQCHSNKCAPDFWVRFAVFEGAPVACGREFERVFICGHGASIRRAPRGFIFCLVEVVFVVADIVMQHPNI